MSLPVRPFISAFSRFRYTSSIVVVAGAALVSSACDLGPQHPTSPGPIETFTLSGTVSERTATGLTPVAGAAVFEEYSHAQATTDDNGFYLLPNVYGATSFVTVKRNGYLPARKTLEGGVEADLDFEVSRVLSYVLSGMVFEVIKSRRTPVVDVELFCHGCGSADGHTFAFTDANGLYSFSWAIGPTEVNVTKEGYRLAGVPANHSTVVPTVNSDTRFDIELVRE